MMKKALFIRWLENQDMNGSFDYTANKLQELGQVNFHFWIFLGWDY